MCRVEVSVVCPHTHLYQWCWWGLVETTHRGHNDRVLKSTFAHVMVAVSIGSESSREAHVTRVVINVSRLRPPCFKQVAKKSGWTPQRGGWSACRNAFAAVNAGSSKPGGFSNSSLSWCMKNTVFTDKARLEVCSDPVIVLQQRLLSCLFGRVAS